MMTQITEHEGQKYLRTIHSALPKQGKVDVDVYCVLEAFQVSCPACQHAIKKILCAGQRSKGTFLEDLQGAVAALNRAVELEEQRIENVRN